MSTIMYFLSQIRSNKKGQGMVEYALIIGLIAIVLIGALAAMNGGLKGIFGDITKVLENPAAATPAAP